MANLIYGTQAFDMVLKYPIAEHLRKAPLTPEQTSINVDNAEKAAAQEGHGLINNDNNATTGADAAAGAANKDLEAGEANTTKIELEAKLEMYRRRFKKALLKEGMVIEEEPNIDGEEMFVKIYTPFWRLCVEAQRLRFKVELMVSFFFLFCWCRCLSAHLRMKRMAVIFNKNTIKPKEGSEFSVLSIYLSQSSYYPTFVHSSNSLHTLSWSSLSNNHVPLTNSSQYTCLFLIIVAYRGVKGKGGS